MASAILNNSLMEQRQKKAMEELEKEMQIELERNKEQLNNELQLALEKELQNHKGDFLNQLAAASNLSRQEIDDVVSNAAMGKNFIISLTQRILGEYLFISSLPGKALRMLVESRGLPSDSSCILKAEPGKLDIKRREPGILFISLPIGSPFKLVI